MKTIKNFFYNVVWLCNNRLPKRIEIDNKLGSEHLIDIINKGTIG